MGSRYASTIASSRDSGTYPLQGRCVDITGIFGIIPVPLVKDEIVKYQSWEISMRYRHPLRLDARKFSMDRKENAR